MKKLLAILCILVLSLGLWACDKAPDPTTVPTETTLGIVPLEGLKLGLICPEAINQPNTPAIDFYNEMKTPAKRRGLDPDTQIVVEDQVSPDTKSVLAAVETLTGQGVNMIFCVDEGFCDAMDAAAEAYPNVIFCQYGSGDGNMVNLIRFFAPMYQIYAQLGAAAGQRSKELESNAIGFVTLYGLEDPEATAAINSFTVAAKIFHPEVTVYVKTAQADQEGEAALSLIQSHGCKVLAQYGGGTDVLKTAREKGVVACGPLFENGERSRDGHLISADFKWFQFMMDVLKAAKECTYADEFAEKLGADSYYGTIGDSGSDYMLTVTEPGPDAGALTKRVADYMDGTCTVWVANEETEDPDDGGFKTISETMMDVFHGWQLDCFEITENSVATHFSARDLKDLDGNIIVPAGSLNCLPVEEIRAMDYYLEGVEPVD